MVYMQALGAAAVLAAMPAAAQSVDITSQVMVEQRTAAADGTTRVALAPAKRVTPGDAVVYRLEYRNRGTRPATDLVIANPIPANLVYAGPSQNSPAPEVSTDGTTFASLTTLRVRGAGGVERAATPADVRAVRWRLTNPVAAGGSGQVAFRATLK